MKLSILLILATLLAGASSGRTRTPPHARSSLPQYGTIAEFTLTDQHGESVRRSDLAGHPWIVDFIFTNCSLACPMMTEEMERLKRTLGEDSVIRTATVTVDPWRDHPRQLEAYARTHHSDDTLYLTGDEQQILGLMKSVHMAAPRVDHILPEMHSSGFVLVDADGAVRGIYYRRTDREFLRLLQDARTLEPSPGR